MSMLAIERLQATPKALHVERLSKFSTQYDQM